MYWGELFGQYLNFAFAPLNLQGTLKKCNKVSIPDVSEFQLDQV